jgi:hypothetical protein
MGLGISVTKFSSSYGRVISKSAKLGEFGKSRYLVVCRTSGSEVPILSELALE